MDARETQDTSTVSRESMEASLRFLDIGAPEVTIPIWAAIYAAPLAAWVKPGFALWIVGGEGSKIATTTALAMSHYGEFTFKTPPASWMDTVNTLERKARVTNRIPLWIDDYDAIHSIASEKELKLKVRRLLQCPRRGLIISTGNAVPHIYFLKHTYLVSVKRGDIDSHKLSSSHEGQSYKRAMADYLRWLPSKNHNLWADYLKKQNQVAGLQGALQPDHTAYLYIGALMALIYALKCGAISSIRQEQLLSQIWDVLIKVNKKRGSIMEDQNLNRVQLLSTMRYTNPAIQEYAERVSKQ